MAKGVLADLARRLREARNKAGITQKQVARFLDTTDVQVSYWENGRRPVDLAALKRLADLYGYSVSWFLNQGRQVPEAIQIAFRAGEPSDADLEVISWARRFVRNLDFLVSIAGADNHD